MQEKFSLLSIESEPSDEQLQQIMAEVLREVTTLQKIRDQNLENQKSGYLIFINAKFPGLTEQTGKKIPIQPNTLFPNIFLKFNIHLQSIKRNYFKNYYKTLTGKITIF